MHICLNQVYYTHVSLIQEAIAVGLEIELARFGSPDSYFEQTIKSLQRKRDETCEVLREVGLTPIVPDGGYFVLADTSAMGKDFDTGAGKEAYDFQFAKWMMKEKVTCSKLQRRRGFVLARASISGHRFHPPFGLLRPRACSHIRETHQVLFLQSELVLIRNVQDLQYGTSHVSMSCPLIGG